MLWLGMVIKSGVYKKGMESMAGGPTIIIRINLAWSHTIVKVIKCYIEQIQFLLSE